MKPLTLAELRHVLSSQVRLDAPIKPGVSSSSSALDQLLPGGGLPLGSTIEILSDDEGGGAYSLALRMARSALTRQPAWAVVDTDEAFYPPAAQLCGLELQHFILVRPPSKDAVWAFTQLLRAPEIGASFWETRCKDNIAFRRFQLAAERGGGLGFLLRPLDAIRKPCWAALRLLAAPIPSCAGTLRVTLLHARGARVSTETSVEVAL